MAFVVGSTGREVRGIGEKGRREVYESTSLESSGLFLQHDSV